MLHQQNSNSSSPGLSRTAQGELSARQMQNFWGNHFHRSHLGSPAHHSHYFNDCPDRTQLAEISSEDSNRSPGAPGMERTQSCWTKVQRSLPSGGLLNTQSCYCTARAQSIPGEPGTQQSPGTAQCHPWNTPGPTKPPLGAAPCPLPAQENHTTCSLQTIKPS